MKKSYNTELVLEREEGKIIIDAMGIIEYQIDYHFGEDADGNRGRAETIVSDITDITAFDEDANVIILTEKEKNRVEEQLTISFFLGG